jgi:hypothetical protein
MSIAAAVIFFLALLHTFSTKQFEHLAHRFPRYSSVLHLLGEVELVFGLWACVLVVFMAFNQGVSSAIAYLESRHYTEPAFVLAIMLVAASKPIIQLVQNSLQGLARKLPFAPTVAEIWLALAIVPLLGSLITEPAAMTIAAMILLNSLFKQNIPEWLKYAGLGTLFVNVSIGGVLTSYAAPPILMVAHAWQWDSLFMLQNFGLRAALAVIINATVLSYVLSRAIKSSTIKTSAGEANAIPLHISLIHVLFLIGIVLSAHHAVIFIGILLLFIAFTQAFSQYQSPLILREAALVSLFLAGLVILGGQQQWWLSPIVSSLQPLQLFFSATALTAVTDNAALTYLGSLIPDISAQAKYMLVAGAVAGGGLTVIANAPNPAGIAIVREGFDEQAVSAFNLLIAATPPTIVAILLFLV